MKLSVPDYIQTISPYVAGKPMEELEREYGIKNPVKIASNENPLGPSPKALKAVEAALKNLHRYPDAGAYYLVNKLAKKLSVSPANIILGTGSDEVIGMLTRVFLQPGDEAILSEHSFLMYEIMIRCDGAIPVWIPLKSLDIDLDEMKRRITPKTRMIFLTSPNNPTGMIIRKKEFDRFIEGIPPEIVIVLDEAYIEFATDTECLNGLAYLDSGRAIVALRTFSKIYGLAGLRIGYGVMPEEMASLLNRVRQAFNTNSLAQIAATAALDDDEFLQKTLTTVREGLKFLYAALDEMGVSYFPTQSNFFLIDVKQSADEVFKRMLKQGVIVRSMNSYGLPQYLRINAGLPAENERFIEAFRKVL
jgi:histidinol-phosphate aminotransferase